MGTQMDLVAKRKDGSEVMVEIALSPLQGRGLPLVVAAIRDIGTYPRVKQALLRARYAETLAQVGRDAVDARDPQVLLDQAPAIAVATLDAAAVMVLLLNTDRQSFRVASCAGPLIGRIGDPPLEATGNTLGGFMLSHGKPVVIADWHSEHRLQSPQSWLDAGVVSTLLVPLFDRGRQIGVIEILSTSRSRFGDDEVRFIESLSSLLVANLQRAQSEEALNHAQRLESVGQLTGGIAHDFNNLLTVIQGNLQVLDEMPSHSDTQSQSLIGAATRAARRGAELTSQLLAFSRRQVLRPSEVDVSALLQSLSGMLHRTLDQRIQIEVSADDSAVVRADAGQLESALLNVAINGRDAMPDGGTLRFSSRTLADLPEAIRRDLDADAPADVPFVAISVQDTGTGMTEEVKERAFEPFFTTKSTGRGTGLGLSTVYGFAKQSKGTVAIDSLPGSGTTVTLYIPSALEQSPMTADAAETAGTIPVGLSVLLVEDDAEVRAVVTAFLSALGCRSNACSSAEDALMVLSGDTSFDVLLSDISLGAGLRGTELAAIAQRQVPQLAVLLMSGYSAELLEADSSSPASWELLRKPYTREELRNALARALTMGGAPDGGYPGP